MSRPPLKFAIFIGASPEHVWDLLIKPDGTRHIFFGTELESTFEIGAPYAYVGPGADGDRTVHVYGKVLEYEPEKRFSFTEHPGPSYHTNHEELETKVTIELMPSYGVTMLTLVNDQWPDIHPGYEKAEHTWAIVLSNLKTLAETGQPLALQW